MAICAKRNKQNDEDCSRSTNLPKEGFSFVCINNACQIHSVVRRKERQRQEDDSYAGEDQNCLVLGVRDNGKFVLLDGTELKELWKTERSYSGQMIWSIKKVDNIPRSSIVWCQSRAARSNQAATLPCPLPKECVPGSFLHWESSAPSVFVSLQFQIS